MQAVTELRRLGHNVVTSLDAGKANSAVPDAEVLAFAVAGVSAAVATVPEMTNSLIRVNRPG